MRYLTTVFVILLAIASHAQSDVQSIVKKVDGRNQGNALKNEMQLIYKNAKNKTVKERTLHNWRLWQDNNNEKILLKFSAPEEIKNSAFLSIKKDGKTTQKLYLPQFGRIRVLPEANKYASFMGSDFLYADLQSRNISNDQNKLIKTTDKHFIVEGILSKKEEFQKRIYKINKETFLIEEVEYYNADKNQLERKMTVLKTEIIDGVVIATHIRMESYKKGNLKSASEIIMKNTEIPQSLSEDLFTDRNLKDATF